MKDANKIEYDILRKAQCRLTKARKEILAVLDRARTPKTIAEISALVSVDEASVYRNIALFRKIGLVEEIVERGAVRRYARAHGHHHHVVCNGCGYALHISCAGVPKHAVSKEEFPVIQSHDVTLYGLCTRCVQ